MNIYLIISVILMILGVMGVFLSFLPGTLLVLAGMLFYGWGTNFQVITVNAILVFGLLTILGILFDYGASLISAKRFKLSKQGFWGMIIGGIVGFFIFNLVGVLLGQFLGILVGELFSGKNFWNSLKAGGAGIAGYLLSTMVNFLLAITMIAYFTLKVLRGS
ncbi:DUF456 domain-containing protein [Alkaliphilus crotonatoxidans]